MTFDGPELALTPANHTALSPGFILAWVDRVQPELPAQVQGRVRRRRGDVAARCMRLASALAEPGSGKDDTVAAIAPNIPDAPESALAIPMLGAVSNADNTRLDADTITCIPTHGGAEVLFVDKVFSALGARAVAEAGLELLIVDIEDSEGPGGALIGTLTYDALLAKGDPEPAYTLPENEWDALELNYTPGTTGRPKGVVNSRRRAWDNEANNAMTWEMPYHPACLWSLPLSHCDGWCFPSTITMLAGCHVFLRAPRADTIYDIIADHGITHLRGAPNILSITVDAEQKRNFLQVFGMMTVAAPPPASSIQKMAAIGIPGRHVYGLTEVYGPMVVWAEKPGLAALPFQQRADLKARHGVAYELEEDLLVLDPDTGAPASWAGRTLGEIAFRGNIVLKRYLKVPEGTATAFKDGRFRSGDIDVQPADSHVEICERSKDIIISSGEKISSIEVERALSSHLAVGLVSVVSMPGEKSGEVPCASFEFSGEATEEDLLDDARKGPAGLNRTRRVIFGDVAKTTPERTRKNELLDRIRERR